jgi:WD40 repeat protein/mono/diheme cytochrome c family protein
MTPRVLLGGLVLLLAVRPASAQEAPSYAKQVKPLLAKYCASCHNSERARGELDLSDVKAMKRGGQNGPAFVGGKPDESLLVTLAEGKDNPKMPPKDARAQPAAAEIAVLRAWIAAGAPDDTVAATATAPDTRPHETGLAPVAALAYRPRGNVLAAGGQNEVVLIDPATGERTGRLHGQDGPVTALAFSRGGSSLAVASGVPGSPGVVRVYFVPPSGLPSNRPEVTFRAPKDVVLGLAFSPDGTLATCGRDGLVRLWDANTGKERRTLQDHGEPVLTVAFSPDGKRLASAGADRAVKVWDAASGACLVTLGEATDRVQAVAWHLDGRHLAAGGADRQIRVWDVSATTAKLEQAVLGPAGPVSRLVYSADGSVLYSLSDEGTAKAWTTATMEERTAYPRQTEKPLSLAVRGDGKQLAVGHSDGTLVLFDEATGKVQFTPLPAKPKAPRRAD